MNTIPLEPEDQGRVALLRCDDYDEARVLDAVSQGVALLGGAQRFVRAGETLLLKPNLLTGKNPDKAVTTHPAVFRAAAQVFLDAGASLVYGDSPGFGRPETVARRAGLAEIAESLGISFADFRTGRTLSYPEGRMIKQFTVAAGVLDADGMVSLPKLKTHALTRVTGAVKNQFGCIPGMLKGEFHGRLLNMERFSEMLVDLTHLLKPRLYIMDAIVAMEGNGPGNGKPRPLRALLLSTDPVALDATACRLINLDPALVQTILAGEVVGLGRRTPIELLGDDADSLVCPDFDVNRKRDWATNSMWGWLSQLMRNRMTPRPVIDEAACLRCGACVEVCPAAPKAVDFPDGDRQAAPRYDYDRCIRCYCCQEMCPHNAIHVETPLLGRLIHSS